MTALPFRAATTLADAVRRREVGCVELLDLYVERCRRLDPLLNAVVVMDLERAYYDAEQADAAIERGAELGPLHGVPMTVKESFDVRGLPTTWGLADQEGHKAERDAVAVERFRRAGANVFGKTNVPTLLADWQTSNPLYGTTNNPWDPSRSPGGSSGGAAAALAAGLTGLEAGSDIGGSIRNPAHYCGVYGHKPTFGICSPWGHSLGGAVARADMSVIGPLARSAFDLEVALGVMAGPDEIDGACWQLALPPEPRDRLDHFKVGVMLTDPVAEVDGEVADRLQALADFLVRQGCRVDDQVRPALDSQEVWEVFLGLLRAATSGRLAEADFTSQIELARRLPADDPGYLAMAARASTMRHRGWLELNERRHRMRRAWTAFFGDFDLLLCPAAASAAVPHDHAGLRNERTIEVNGHPVPATAQLFWAGYSGLAYLPSTTAPNGLTPQGLPVGVQIVAPHGYDLRAIRFAQLLEQAWCGFVPPDGWA